MSNIVDKQGSDFIDRQVAIDAITNIYTRSAKKALQTLELLPPADTDLSDYSDKLWKAAYERGKEETIDRVIEIIGSVSDDWLEDDCEWAWYGEMQKRVLDLKGGEQE